MKSIVGEKAHHRAAQTQRGKWNDKADDRIELAPCAVTVGSGITRQYRKGDESGSLGGNVDQAFENHDPRGTHALPLNCPAASPIAASIRDQSPALRLGRTGTVKILCHSRSVVLRSTRRNFANGARKCSGT